MGAAINRFVSRVFIFSGLPLIGDELGDAVVPA